MAGWPKVNGQPIGRADKADIAWLDEFAGRSMVGVKT